MKTIERDSKKVLRKFLAYSLFIAAVPQAVVGQTYGRLGDIEAVGTAYHVYARPGDATVQVLVMGLGGGIYEVSEGTRLDELLALVGGASDTNIGSRSNQFRRSTTVRLYRTQGAQRTLVYEAPMEQMLLQPGEHPALHDQDLFVIETVDRTRFGWRDGLQILTSSASIILLIERFVRRF